MTEDIISRLIALRNKHGHDSPIGHRASNILELVGNLPSEGIPYLTSSSDIDQGIRVVKGIQKQSDDLTKLMAA